MPAHRALPLALALSLAMAALGMVSCAAATAPAASPARETVDDRPLRAGFLLVDGVYNTELTAPYDVLQHTRYHSGERPAIEVFTVSPDGNTVTSAEGLTLVPDYSFATAPEIDILVVPSAEGSRDRDLDNRELVAWVGQTGRQARYVVSLCWGAFLLAEAGLLDGGAATTFPADYESFAARYPEIDVKVNVSFVHDGPALTSQGGVRSFDVAMYLVALLYGDDTASGVGGGLLIPWPPEADRPMYITDDAAMMSRPQR